MLDAINLSVINSKELTPITLSWNINVSAKIKMSSSEKFLGLVGRSVKEESFYDPNENTPNVVQQLDKNIKTILKNGIFENL